MSLKTHQKSRLFRVKKAPFAPVALTLGLFIAGCTLPDDDDSGGDDSNLLTPPTGSAQSYLGYGYDIVKSSYVNRGDVKMSNPILDQKKLTRDKMLVSDAANSQDFQVSVGGSVKKFYSNRNASLGIDVGGSGIGAALFSGKFGFEFGVSLDESRIDSNSYLRGHSYRYTRDEYIIGMSTQILREYLTDGFVADLSTRTAAQFLDRYGTHVLVRYYKGGALEFNYAYYGTKLTTDAQMRTALTASINVVNGGITSNQNANSIELENNSVFHYYTYGGKAIGAFSVGELKSDYNSWLSSIESKADICGIGDFDNSLIPVWELAEAVGLSSMAVGLENEFNQRAILAGKALLVKKIRTDNTAYTTSGTRTYTFSNAGPNSPAEIEVYALGAGGGGQGGNDKDGTYIPIIGSDSYSGTGGAGGGGAAAYMKLAVTKAVSFSVVVGSGGSGGNYTNSGIGGSGESGSPGGNGGNTSVTWSSENIALTANGGFGGGGKDQIVTGGNGGTYTPPTALETILKDKGGIDGGKGSNGSLKTDIKSEGGKAGAINKGSLSSFGGGVGAVRPIGGNNNKQDGERGGGGSGGYGWSDKGVAGGTGEVRIIVKYYVDE